MPFSWFDPEVQKKVAEIISTGWISTFGGAAYYFYRVSKGDAFRFGRFLLSLFLAGFVGYVVGKLMPGTIGADVRDGLIAMSGFSTFPILDILEKKWVFLLAKKVWIDDPSLSDNAPPNAK